MPRPAWPTRSSSDEDIDQKPTDAFECSIKQMTASVLDMHERMGQFMELCEPLRLTSLSLEQRREYDDKLNKMNRTMDEILRVQMDIVQQTNERAQEKKLWERELKQLQDEVNYWLERAILSRVYCDSSTQTTTQHKRDDKLCYIFPDCYPIPDHLGTSVTDTDTATTRLILPTKYHQKQCNTGRKSRAAWIRYKKKDSSADVLRAPDTNRLRGSEGNLEPPCESTATKESGNNQPQEQRKVQKAVGVAQTVQHNVEDVPEEGQDERLLVTASVIPTSTRHTTDDQARKQLRNKLMSLLDEHNSCEDPECSIIRFQNYLIHADKCVSGSQCRWYICKYKHSRAEHLRVCNKTHCELCLPYLRLNEANLQCMMKVLETGCSLKQERTSRRDVVMTMIARLAVNYRLVGDCNEKETQHLMMPRLDDDQIDDCLSASEDTSEWEYVEYDVQVSK